MRPVPLAATCFLAAALAVAPTRAQPLAPPVDPATKPHFVTVTVHLDFILGPGTYRCPQAEEYLHREVARRMGYDPFTLASGRPIGRVRVLLARAPQGLTATYDYVNADGVPQWQKTYPVNGADRSACELAMTGVAMETLPDFRIRDESPPPPPVLPEPLGPPQPAPASPPSAPPTPEPAPALPPAAPRDRPLHLHFEAGLSIFAAIGMAPRLTGGGALHAGLAFAPFGHERARVSFGFEGSITAPVADDHGIRTRLLAGALVACGDVDLIPGTSVTWGFLVCGVGMFGVVRSAWQNVDGVASRSGTFVAFGGRFGWQARLGAVVVRLQGEALPAVRPGRARGFAAVATSGTGDVVAAAGLALLFPF